MMHRQPTSSVPPILTDAAMPPRDASEPAVDALAHADYDLRPLLVRSFEHYVEPVEEEERFHVR